MLVDWAGNVDSSTTFGMGSSEYLAGIVSVDGTGFYIAGSAGLKYAPFGNPNTAATTLTSTTTTSSLRNGVIGPDGAMYYVTVTSPYGVTRLFSPPYPTTTQTILGTSGIIPATQGLASTYPTALWFDDEGSLW